MYEIIYKVTVSRFLHSPKLVSFYFSAVRFCGASVYVFGKVICCYLNCFSAGWAKRAHGTSYLRFTPTTAWRPMWSQSSCHSRFTAFESWPSIGWAWVCHRRSPTTSAPFAKVSDAALISCSFRQHGVREHQKQLMQFYAWIAQSLWMFFLPRCYWRS